MNYPGMQTYQHVAKKYVHSILQERYAANDSILTRLTHYLTSEQDVKDFVQLFIDSYEKGYLKAVDDNREKFRQLGYEVKVTAEKSVKGGLQG